MQLYQRNNLRVSKILYFGFVASIATRTWAQLTGRILNPSAHSDCLAWALNYLRKYTQSGTIITCFNGKQETIYLPYSGVRRFQLQAPVTLQSHSVTWRPCYCQILIRHDKLKDGRLWASNSILTCTSAQIFCRPESSSNYLGRRLPNPCPCDSYLLDKADN